MLSDENKMKFFKNFFSNQFYALFIKEITQILRDKKIIALLIFPTITQVLLYGLALNPDVKNIDIGIIDYSQSYESRELISALTENGIFKSQSKQLTEKELETKIFQGKLIAGLIIPPEFKRNLARNKPTEFLILVDGVDANKAGITQGYLKQIISKYAQRLRQDSVTILVKPEIIFINNQGLKSSWFFIPGALALSLSSVTSLVSSATVIREKDQGTLEQLLMTPAKVSEIIIAKISPLFLLLIGDVIGILVIICFIFRVPFRGNLLLFIVLSGLYIFVGIGIGIMLATISRTQQQAYITSFFISLPLALLSGVISPIESMPPFFQYLSFFNPLRHYVTIIRAIFLKGVGLEVLWPNTLVLLISSVLLLSISISKFRRQLI